MIRAAAARRRASRSGYVLIVALFVLVVVMTASMLVATALTRQMRTYQQELRNTRLTAMSDGALSMALARLWSDPDWGGTSEPFAEGTLTIETRKINGLTVEVTVSAAYAGGGRAARARVRISREPPDRRPPPRVLLWEPITYQP